MNDAGDCMGSAVSLLSVLLCHRCIRCRGVIRDFLLSFICQVLQDRPIGKSFISKLSYRFANTHTCTFDSNSCYMECLCFDPRNFFGGKRKDIRKIFDLEAMRSWIDLLHDVDEEGLPKAMVKEHWDRRLLKMTVVDRHVDWEIQVFEHDSATDVWSRLRCTATMAFLRGP